MGTPFQGLVMFVPIAISGQEITLWTNPLAKPHHQHRMAQIHRLMPCGPTSLALLGTWRRTSAMWT